MSVRDILPRPVEPRLRRLGLSDRVCPAVRCLGGIPRTTTVPGLTRGRPARQFVVDGAEPCLEIGARPFTRPWQHPAGLLHNFPHRGGTDRLACRQRRRSETQAVFCRGRAREDTGEKRRSPRGCTVLTAEPHPQAGAYELMLVFSAAVWTRGFHGLHSSDCPGSDLNQGSSHVPCRNKRIGLTDLITGGYVRQVPLAEVHERA